MTSMSNHLIPPMTHPISSGWDQPSRKDIVIIKDTAYMKQASFDKLSSRDWGFPTGVYEGKMWRCKMRLVWFIRDPKDEKMCMTQARDIEIVETLPVICTNCGEIGSHYVPPGGGGVGFYYCKPAGECKTCDGEKKIRNNSTAIAYGADEMIPCPTCQKDEYVADNTKTPDRIDGLIIGIDMAGKGEDTTEVTMLDGTKADIDRKLMEQAIDPHGKVFGGKVTGGGEVKPLIDPHTSYVSRKAVDEHHGFIRDLLFPSVKYRRNTLPIDESYATAVDIGSFRDLRNAIYAHPKDLDRILQDDEEFDGSKLEINRFYAEEVARRPGWKTHIVQYGSYILGYLSGPLPAMPPATPTVRFCTHAGTDESDIPDIGTLTSVLKILYPKRGIEEGDLEVSRPKEFKEALGGPNTHLVLHNGFIVGFLDGPLPPAKTKEPIFKSAEAWPTPSCKVVLEPKESFRGSDYLDAPQPEHREIPPEVEAIIRLIEMAHHRFEQVRGTRMFPANVYQTPAEYAAYMIEMKQCHEIKDLARSIFKQFNEGRCTRCGLEQPCKETP